MYNSAIQNAARGVAQQKPYTVEIVSVTYKGTTYQKGMAVLLGGTENGYELGKIVGLLVNQERLYYVCEKFWSVLALDLGIHV